MEKTKGNWQAPDRAHTRTNGIKQFPDWPHNSHKSPIHIYIYNVIYDAIKKVPTVEAEILILLPFRFRSASVFLPLCGNLGWSFRVSFAKCRVMIPFRFRYAGGRTDSSH